MGKCPNSRGVRASQQRKSHASRLRSRTSPSEWYSHLRNAGWPSQEFIHAAADFLKFPFARQGAAGQPLRWAYNRDHYPGNGKSHRPRSSAVALTRDTATTTRPNRRASSSDKLYFSYPVPAQLPSHRPCQPTSKQSAPAKPASVACSGSSPAFQPRPIRRRWPNASFSFHAQRFASSRTSRDPFVSASKVAQSGLGLGHAQVGATIAQDLRFVRNIPLR